MGDNQGESRRQEKIRVVQNMRVNMAKKAKGTKAKPKAKPKAKAKKKSSPKNSSVSSNRNWKTMDALDTLIRAEELKRDKKMMGRVKVEAEKRERALNKITIPTR